MVSPKMRYQVLERDRFTCQLCGRSAPEVKLEADHIIPKAEGGPDRIENLRATCEECNGGRGTLVSKKNGEAVSVQSFPLPWFGVNHGVDNYEDLIKLADIQTVHFNWATVPGTDGEEWIITCHITFKNRDKYELSLNPEGYTWFLRALKQVK